MARRVHFACTSDLKGIAMKTRPFAVAAIFLTLLAVAPALRAQATTNRSSAQANLHLNVYVVPVVMNNSAQPGSQRVVLRSSPAEGDASGKGIVAVFTLPSSDRMSIDQTVTRSWLNDPQPAAGRSLAVLETTIYVPR